MRYLIERLGERTTWLGFLAVAAALGISVNPDLQEEIVTAGTAIAGIIGILTRG